MRRWKRFRVLVVNERRRAKLKHQVRSLKIKRRRWGAESLRTIGNATKIGRHIERCMWQNMNDDCRVNRTRRQFVGFYYPLMKRLRSLDLFVRHRCEWRTMKNHESLTNWWRESINSRVFQIKPSTNSRSINFLSSISHHACSCFISCSCTSGASFHLNEKHSNKDEIERRLDVLLSGDGTARVFDLLRVGGFVVSVADFWCVSDRVKT